VTLRPYQIIGLDRVRAAVRAGHRRILLVSATGSGKTVMMASMIQGAQAKGNRSLVVAHRRELIEQTHDRFAHEGIHAGIIMAGHPKTEALTQVGSIQTLSRRSGPPPAISAALGGPDPHVIRGGCGDHAQPLPEVKILIIDEAHHAKAAQYERLLTAYPDAVVVGLTASPWRLDGRGLGDIFTHLVLAATPAELIRDGYLCNYTGFAFQAPDLSEVKTVAGDWDEAGLSLAYQKSTIFADIIEKWSQHAKGRQTIVFAASIENSEAIVARFNGAGVQAAHLDYRTPAADRARVLQEVRAGRVRVLSNVNLLGEGIDLPELSCAILARPTKSLTVYLQQVGRVMRPKADGSKALILDHAGNVERHGLPDSPRSYDLTTTKPKEVVPALRTCKVCFAIWEGAGACPECGTATEAVSRTGPEVSLAHSEVDIRSVTRRDVDAFKRELVRTALERGYSPGWAVHRFLEKFPGAPRPWGIYREIKAAGADGLKAWRDA
jgi:DNA repair protein RadD